MRIPHPHDFSSRLRSPAVAARVGVWLGVSFVLCFLTGLVSHWAQLPSPAIRFPTSPSWGYRATQGLHVGSGCAAVPLLLVKLWAVYPRLFERVDLRAGRQALVVGLERASIGVLVKTGSRGPFGKDAPLDPVVITYDVIIINVVVVIVSTRVGDRWLPLQRTLIAPVPVGLLACLFVVPPEPLTHHVVPTT